MIVMKFGGTSVEDAKAMRNVAGIVMTNARPPAAFVASACAPRVDQCAAHPCREALPRRGREHALAAGGGASCPSPEDRPDLFSGEVLFTVQSQIDAMMDELPGPRQKHCDSGRADGALAGYDCRFRRAPVDPPPVPPQ